MLGEQLFIGTVYLAGLLSFFSPCIFPVLPIYLSILSQGGKRSVLRTIAFLLGLSITFIILGFGSGFLGAIFSNDLVRMAIGLIIIILGLFQAELIKWNILERTALFKSSYEGDGILKPFFLGFTFSFGWTPCIGPILASIVLVSSTSGDVGRSLFTMMIYMLGLSTPFIIFSLASESLLPKMNFIKPHLGTIKKVGGYMIIIMGLLLFLNKVNIFIV